MFSYCGNNPVRNSDPLGLAGIGLMSGWDPQEYFHSSTKSHTPYPFHDVILDAIFYSAEVSVGIGMGARVSANLTTIGIGGGFAHNVAEVYLENGEIGVRQTDRYGISADCTICEFGIGRENYKDMNFNELPSEDNWDVFRYKIPDISFSAELYLLYLGASVHIGINWDKFNSYIASHAERIS